MVRDSSLMRVYYVMAEYFSLFLMKSLSVCNLLTKSTVPHFLNVDEEDSKHISWKLIPPPPFPPFLIWLPHSILLLGNGSSEVNGSSTLEAV